jgi:hypothetical protein
MHTKTKHSSGGELSQVKQGFDRWRRQHQKRRRRIPDYLWRMAAKAASVHGVYATARELRLNSTRLKEQLHAFGQGQSSEETPGFVEFPWTGVAPVPECILEAEDQTGRKLRVHLKGSATAQAASLGQMLWGRGE